MIRWRGYALATVLLVVGAPAALHAQEAGSLYAGGLVGIATLSADAQSSMTATRADVALYAPENGAALTLFVGVHLGRFVSVQANYVWNRNDLTVFSSMAALQGGGFHQQPRASGQHTLVGDVLLYFRSLDDRIRPYLSTGAGAMRFASNAASASVVGGLAPPEAAITSTHAVLRVAVGIDVEVARGWSARYSFSETISSNPVSVRLMPPGRRSLANFQNLVGVVRRF